MTTPTPTEDIAALRELLARYLAALDDHTLDTALAEAVLTEDAQLVRPNGSTLTGRAEIAAGQTQSLTRFRATQHLSTDHIIDQARDTDPAGRTASIRANLVATHLWARHHAEPDATDSNALEDYFIAGSVLRAQARRTAVGWRLHRLELSNTWRAGNGFNAMAHIGAP